MKSKLLILLSLSLLGLTMLGCAADLLSITPTGQTDPAAFCNLRDGKLVVIVKNQGRGAAGPFTTKVEFFKGGTYGVTNEIITMPPPAVLPLLALGSGASQELLPPAFPVGIEFPVACYNLPTGPAMPCYFRITVNDGPQKTEETDYGNNISIGQCPAP